MFLCENGEEAYETFKKETPKLLVLDVMMPKKDGFTLAKEIRQEDDTIPIIFLTAKSQIQDVVEGFSIGGNDYLKKPFSIEELIVRINNLLNRTKLQNNSKIFQIGDYHFNFPKQTLQFKAEKIVQLTNREAHLLFHLYKNKNELLDRSIILKKLWGEDDFFNARSMDVFISKLRKEIKIGYRDSNHECSRFWLQNDLLTFIFSYIFEVYEYSYKIFFFTILYY